MHIRNKLLTVTKPVPYLAGALCKNLDWLDLGVLFQKLVFLNAKHHCRAQNSPPPDSIMSQINPMHFLLTSNSFSLNALYSLHFSYSHALNMSCQSHIP